VETAGRNPTSWNKEFEGSVVVTGNLDVKTVIRLRDRKDLENWVMHVELKMRELHRMTGHTPPPQF